MKAIKGNVIIKMDVLQKWKYNLTEDIQIQIEKGHDFNLRQDRPSRGYCINGDGIPYDAEVLVHHLTTEMNYEVPYIHEFLTEKEIEDGFQIFNIPEDMVFAYRTDKKEWTPYKHFLITQRLFKEYEGPLTGMPKEKIKNRLLVVNGKDEWDGEETDLSGKVMIVTENSDYEIIFHDTDNRPYSIIRTRQRELVAIDEGLTKQVFDKKIFVGLDEKNCHPLN